MSSTNASVKAQQAAVIPPHLRLCATKMVSNMLEVAVSLGVPDLLKDGKARSADELAKQCGAHPDRLYRVMRALTNDDVFVEHEGKTFTLGEQGQFFTTDHPYSCADIVKYVCGPSHSIAWLQLRRAVQTGECAAELAWGEDGFSHYRRHPDEERVLHNCLTQWSRVTVPPCINAYKDEWGKYKTICEVGGGQGFCLAEILKAAGDNSCGILYESESVLADAGAIMAAAGVENRVRLEGGDPTNSVPKQVDLYVLRFMLRYFNDDKALKILKNCVRGLNAAGRVLIVEAALPGPNVPSIPKWIDIDTCVMQNGRERTEEEWTTLAEAAGLKLNRIVPTGGELQLFELETTSTAATSSG